MEAEEPSLTVQLQPRKGMFVGDKMASGKLVLPLASSRLAVFARSSKLPGFPSHGEAGTPMKDLAFCFVNPGFKEKFAAAWAIDTVTDEDEANCEIKMRVPLKSSDLPGYRLPCVVNTKPLTAGAELKIFKAKPEKAEKVAKGLKRSFEPTDYATITGPSAKSKPQ